MDTVNIYLNTLGHDTSLTVEQQAELHARMQAGDESARHALIESVLPFAFARAWAWSTKTSVPIEDLIGAANVGVVVAVDKFDPSKGKLSTVAWWWMEHELTDLIRRRETVVALPQCRGNMATRSAHRNKFGGSLDHEYVDGGDIFSLKDILPGDAVEPIDLAERREVVAHVQRLVEHLPERERYIVTQRLRGRTRTDIGAEMGVHRERIKQIETRAHGRLKTWLGMRPSLATAG